MGLANTGSIAAPREVHVAGQCVPMISANTVVVGTGAAGYCAADRLAQFGQHDVVMVTDKIRAGTSRNAGSDKQTYYKLTLSGAEPDSVAEMARTLFDGGAMDGDIALAEAAGSARAFLHLVDLGVPFPQNEFGEFAGYKTDHDPRTRATSVGPYTSRSMVERLEEQVRRQGTRILDECRVVDLITADDGAGGRRVVGLLVLRTDVRHDSGRSPWLLLRCTNIVYATGGPAGLYATRVFPNGQWGASGAALRAGARGRNLTEWQFGLASIRPRWNVSGTYMQAMPRFVSTDDQGGDEREFLTEAIASHGRLMSLVFLKGYQWPFDIRKARAGSSLIDLLVHQETVLRRRRVFLDFRANPGHKRFDPANLSPEARDYMGRAGALQETPIARLRHMNEPAYRFYLERNPCIDLEEEMLEVAVCAQHNNGGLAIDAWWQSNLAGLFPVGEAAGAHGVYRPGGAALNSGQVGATRAAEYIATRRTHPPLGEREFTRACEPVLAAALAAVGGAITRHGEGTSDNTEELMAAVQELMSAKAGLIRSAASIDAALAEVTFCLTGIEDLISADGSSRRSVSRIFLLRDILTSAYVYLSAMADYLARGGRSRGSALYTDPQGGLPRVGYGPDAHVELPLPPDFRFCLDEGALDDMIQETAWEPGAAGGKVTFQWRRRHPVPAPDDFFENVWREFRERRAM